jgi:hypothetical protein
MDFFRNAGLSLGNGWAEELGFYWNPVGLMLRFHYQTLNKHKLPWMDYRATEYSLWAEAYTYLQDVDHIWRCDGSLTVTRVAEGFVSKGVKGASGEG